MIKSFVLSLTLVFGLTSGAVKASDEFEMWESPFSEITEYPSTDTYVTGPWIRPSDTAQQILTISTDAFPGITQVEVGRDDVTFELKTLNVRSDDGHTSVYTLQQLRLFQSVKKVKDRDAVFLRVESDFEPVHGGYATLRFLQNGLWGTYRNFRMMIDVQGKDIVLRSEPSSKDPDSDRNPYQGTFNHLFMRKNTIMGQVAGIDEVVPSMR